MRDTLAWRTRVSVVVERLSTQLKVSGSNPDWVGERPANNTLRAETAAWQC